MIETESKTKIEVRAGLEPKEQPDLTLEQMLRQKPLFGCKNYLDSVGLYYDGMAVRSEEKVGCGTKKS